MSHRSFFVLLLRYFVGLFVRSYICSFVFVWFLPALDRSFGDVRGTGAGCGKQDAGVRPVKEDQAAGRLYPPVRGRGVMMMMLMRMIVVAVVVMVMVMVMMTETLLCLYLSRGFVSCSRGCVTFAVLWFCFVLFCFLCHVEYSSTCELWG